MSVTQIQTRLLHDYLAELSDIADTLALEGLEVGGNTTVLEIDDSGKRLVQERSKRGNGEVTGFGLLMFSTRLTEPFGARTAKVWIMALKPMSTLPLPMISVTSEGSLGSSKATLSPSSLK